MNLEETQRFDRELFEVDTVESEATRKGQARAGLPDCEAVDFQSDGGADPRPNSLGRLQRRQ